MFKFCENALALRQWLDSILINKDIKQDLDLLMYPNIFCLIDLQGFTIVEVPRREIEKFNQYCGDMWK